MSNTQYIYQKYRNIKILFFSIELFNRKKPENKQLRIHTNYDVLTVFYR